MNNDWLKEKVKEELEVEYKAKLDEVLVFCEQKVLAAYEECYNQTERIKKENSEIETKLYKEFEEKLIEYKKFVRMSVIGVVEGLFPKEGVTAPFIMSFIDKTLGYMGENTSI